MTVEDIKRLHPDWTLGQLVDKLAYEIMKAEKIEKTPQNIVETVKYLEATPQVKALRNALGLLSIIENNFKIELYKNGLNNAISIYSDTDRYAVCHTINEEEAEQYKQHALAESCWEIVKAKRVSIVYLKDSLDVEQYNEFAFQTNGYASQLTSDEFNTLKEGLK